MIAVFIAVFLILAVMIYFITVSLRIVSENASKKVNAYFLSKLGEYDDDFKEKMNTLEKLKEARNDLEQQIKLLEADHNSLEVSRFYKPRPIIRDTYIPVAHYIDSGFFEDYKKAKTLLVMDKAQIIRDIMAKFPYEGNLERYKLAEQMINELNPQAMYELCTLPVLDQLKVLRESFSEDMLLILNEFIEPLYSDSEFDILKFKAFLKLIEKQESPYLYARIGAEDEDYSDVHPYVKCEFDANICEGIRIEYQGRLYDYSIYESRKRR